MTKHVIKNNITLRQALQTMNDNRVKFLVVCDENGKLCGTLTDGDVRRSILAGKSLEGCVTESICTKFTFLNENGTLSDAIEAFRNERIEFLPVINSEGILLNLITRRNLHVLMLKDITFSTSFDFSSLDDIILDHNIFARPWGFYKTTVLNDMYQAKVIYVMPGQSLSLQSHNRREEYWQIVKGTGTIRIGERLHDVHSGENYFIPKTYKHRISNTSSTETLIFTEIQLGDYFGEDDIIRYEDVYNRV